MKCIKEVGRGVVLMHTVPMHILLQNQLRQANRNSSTYSPRANGKVGKTMNIINTKDFPT